jgi:hypothetical protein
LLAFRAGMSADTATAPPQLRPLALGEILDVSIKLMRRNWRTLCVLVLIVAVPVAVVNFLVTTSTTTYDATLDIRSPDDDSAYDAGQVVNAILGIALYLVASVGCVHAVGEAYMGRAADWRSSLRVGARRALPALGLSILYVLGLFFGFLALIIPAIFLAIRWSVAMPALVLERRGPIAALGRSWSLVGGFWWKCFGTLLIAYLLLIVVSVAFGAVLGGVLAVLSSVDSFLGLLLQQAVNVVIQAFTLPLFAAVTVVLYVDLRVRKEGFDLALAADRIANPDRPVAFRTTAEPEPPRHPAFGE